MPWPATLATWRTDAADLARDFRVVEAQVAAAIVRWQGYGEPVPHLESL